MSSVQLTKHFFLDELIVSSSAVRAGLDNTPPSLLIPNVFKMAELLEKVRSACGNKAVSISSGYRSPAVNKLVGGSASSDHLTGSAADILVPGFGNPLQVCKAVIAAKIPFGQLIWEGNWTHISLPTDKHAGEVLTAIFPKGGGKVIYVKGLPS